MNLIEFRDVHKVYSQGRREVRALNGLSMTVEQGEFVAVVGPSGSGKSTFLHLAGGLDLPTSGEVIVNGQVTSSLSDFELTCLRRKHIGFVFQAFNLVPTLTAMENTALPALLTGGRFAEVRPKAEAMLQRVGLLDRVTHRPEELSGGELQRVAIARCADQRSATVARRRADGQPRQRERLGDPRLAPGDRQRTNPGHHHPRPEGGFGRPTVDPDQGRPPPMIALLRLFSLRYFRSHKLRTLLAFSAIALGVALFVSSYVTNVSVVASIEQTKQDLAGKAEWQVTRGRSLGVEETLLKKIRTIPSVIAAPVIQASAPLVKPRGETLLILGIEFLNDSLLRLYKIKGPADTKTLLSVSFVPNGILVAARFAERHGLKVGSPITIESNRGEQVLRITGLLEDAGPARALEGRFGVMEIHVAQRLFRRPGLVDRIEVAGASRTELEQACPGFRSRIDRLALLDGSGGPFPRPGAVHRQCNRPTRRPVHHPQHGPGLDR